MRPELVKDETRRPAAPVTDFWFAQVDLRLSKIEALVERLERQIWGLVYAAGGILLIEGLRALAGL
ncbi:hypothetical protein [Histidinibacterium aquaticum]|uniref:Uncharacterized protein n=1 Tax=Histidinibacterium aquaticum TaxID=2613962 RepID=A0A5J5GLM1_9RHOB|nr:hypothetical protein [Histidinibacterium aquaticum]KAA9009030.1 hypothetical protein F3S47_07165 [Histidinibacterium aquaticum]